MRPAPDDVFREAAAAWAERSADIRSSTLRRHRPSCWASATGSGWAN
ncbi:hypothetical protein [Streptomyces hirsutus]